MTTQTQNKPRIIPPAEKDLGGFKVRRLLPAIEQRMAGPFIFFDHMGPAAFAVGQGIDVRPHPHIGLATVTYLFDGQLMHRDSLGTAKTIMPGDLNLMVAGHGITHSERTPADVRNSKSHAHGLQLWIGLPDDMLECEPAFHHYPAQDIPKSDIADGVVARQLMGTGFGMTSPVRTFQPTIYTEIQMTSGSTLQADKPCQEMAIYLVSGQLSLNGDDLQEHHMAIMNDGNFTLHAKTDCQLAIVGGSPLGKRHLEWNFVASTRDRLNQAKHDWLNGAFPKVPGDEDDFIPLPDHLMPQE